MDRTVDYVGSLIGELVRCEVADAAKIPLEDNSVDLVMCSPPYESMRDYGIGYALTGDAWVDWCVERYVECLRVCRGLVVWVVGAGMTKNYKWSAAPDLLSAALARTDGVVLRSPLIYKRHGRPGSGGPDWFRADYEKIICATSTRGRLPWSDVTSCGWPPKFGPGGRAVSRGKCGVRVRSKNDYRPPKLVNPGTVVDCGAVGGGNMGSKLAHANSASYPDRLVERFVRSFCPPGGLVLDPFSGSGTTAAVAVRHGRDAIAFDIRESQVSLTNQRVKLEVDEIIKSRRIHHDRP